MKNLFLIAFIVVLFPFSAAAQDDEDAGFLTRTIQNALSGAGRDVRISGFEGALSSEASFDQMTIADDEGIWLTLENVVLNWSRLALLRGRLEVDSLTAETLLIPRLPVVEETEELPSAEAEGFTLSLPELPVSVNIGTFQVEKIDLGEPIIGAPVQVSLAATARLDDDGLNVDLTADRIDDVAGSLGLKAVVVRDGSQISLDLGLVEEPGGIASRLLNLPGQPSVDLKIAGTGPLSEFAADIDLATDGAPRLDGKVTLVAEPGVAEGAAPDRRVRATLGGDISSLIAPDYQDFFGPDVGLDVDTLLRADGAIDVQRFAVTAQAVDLSGAVRLNSDLWPEFIDVAGRVAQDSGPVLLPGSDAGITVDAIDLDVDFDAATNNAIRGAFNISRFVHDAVQVERTRLTLNGRLDGDISSVGEFVADLVLDASGVGMADKEAAQALGGQISGGANINYVEGQPIEISSLTLSGADYGLDGDLVIAGLENGFPTDLDVALRAQDLSRFAGLAGQALQGAADLALKGKVTPLGGSFDLVITGRTDNLGVGIEQADAVLAGRTEVALQATRDGTGTYVKDLSLANNALDVTGDLALRSVGSEVDILAKLADVSLVLPDYQGALSVDAEAQETEEGWVVKARADAPYDSTLVIDGLATGENADIRFDLSVPEVRPYVPSVQGPLMAQGTAKQSPDGYVVDITADGPYEAKVALEGLATGPDANLSVQASMPNIGVLVPDINGPLSIDGDVARAGTRWEVSTDVDGPSGMTATVDGTVAEDGNEVDLGIVGQLPLGLSAPFLAPRVLRGQAEFDLAVRGAPGLEAVSGRISTAGATFTAPDLRVNLTELGTVVNLAGGNAQIDGSTVLSTGGRATVAGNVNLNSLVANLAIGLREAILKDPRLYSATLNGDINIDGALTGGASIAGAITLDEVVVTVPASGITSIGAIPEIRHVGERSSARATRARAGLLAEKKVEQSQSNAGPAYPLNIVLNAPSRIFVRGRGLEAELGGGLEISGDTNNIISAGSFDLIRGRLDIIGKRFELDLGSIQFQGSVTPYINFVTTTDVPEGTASIAVEGLADKPEITFSAVPEAPEDEVLALILFGRSVSELSAFQALQLANGIAQLTGTGGVNVIGGLRDGIGLDELDVSTTDSGEAQVTAGKYLTDDIYTDVTTSGEGGTDVSLNIDLTKELTGKATVGSEGDSSIGLFFERDY